MRFVLREAKPEDFETARAFHSTEAGDLCGAAIPYAWPLPENHTDEDYRARVDWSCQQQKELLENDASVRPVMVVDADNNDELIAFGRWHRYPNGYQHVMDLEACGLKDRNDPATFPEGFDAAFHTGWMAELFGERRDWMGTGTYWVLTNIKTREPFQKRGAGSLILKWGLEQAASEGVPAFLEAVPTAKHIYETHGFREVGQQKLELFSLSRMRADPK